MSSRNILVMIGAGASKGHSAGKTPPLGRELGQVLSLQYEAFKKIEDKTGIRCGSDFEKWTASIGDDGESYTESLAILGHYFRSYSSLSDDSIYLDLINKFSKESTTYISLNYESLIELAAVKLGFNIDWGTDKFKMDLFNINYRAKRKCTILKPHGSANFIASGQCLFNLTHVCCDITSQINCETVIVKEEPHSYKLVVPVLSAYETEKRNSFNDSFINGIRKASIYAANKADVVVVIGIRHSPEDKFLPDIFDALSPDTDIWYIGGESDFKGYENQFANGRRCVFHVCEKFTLDSLNMLENELVLN